MQPFSCLGVLCFLCISHDLLILQVFSEYEFATNLPAQVCNRTRPLQMQYCTDPGNKSSLFVREGLCAAFESFLNCSSDQPDLGAFEDATPGHLLAPQIEGIYSFGNYTHINLKWDMILLPTTTACDHPPFHVADVDNMIPEVINLTTFANGAFQFSPFNLYLLFNCNRSLISTISNFLKEDSLACQEYLENQKRCTKLNGPDQIMNSSCVQLMPFQELKLHEVLEMYSCSHFHSLVNNTLHPDLLSNWITGMVQLFYGDIDCEHCINNGGQCIFNGWFNETTRNFVECRLKVSSNHSTNSGCKGFSCTGVKIVTGLAVAVGTTVVVSLILLALCCPAHTRTYFAIQKVRKRLRMQEVPGSNPSFSHLNLDGLTERTVEYSYASIVSATNSFTTVLGEGGFGVVYKGTLTHANDDLHMQIAVKVLHVRSKHSKKQFLNEVATIGRIHNVHVVRLLGICIQQNHEMLVYEYLINGSLGNWLFNHNQVLHWGQRYSIAVGIAKGLCYLHEECRHRIVHCDIKPENILLDGQMCPKIADFGLARLMSREESRVATLARGTPGYMAPEFWMGGESQLSTKFDVYSYGMVLLELMSGRRNFSNGLNFPEVAFQAAMRGDFESIMDVKLGNTKPPDDGVQWQQVRTALLVALWCIQDHPGSRPPDDDQSMKLDGVHWQQVRTALLVALWCIQDHPGSRPSMSEVVQYLEGNATINEQPPPPAIASTLAVSAQQHPYLSKYRHYIITPIRSGR